MQTHCRTLKKIATIFLFAVLAVIVPIAASQNTDDPYIDIKDAAQTCVFFRRSGNTLKQYEVDGKVCIRKRQRLSPISIHIDMYTLQQIPDQIADALVFDHLIIRSTSNSKRTPLNTEVVEKLLWFLRTVHTHKLTISGFKPVTHTATTIDMPTLDDGRPSYVHPECQQPIPRLLKVYTKRLVLESISEDFATWILPRLDLKESVFSLHINQRVGISNLCFLDALNPGSLLTMHVYTGKGVGSIDCALLREQRVRDGLMVKGPPNPIHASPDIMQAIASKNWAKLCVPVRLWCSIAAVLQQPITIVDLTLDHMIPQYDPIMKAINHSPIVVVKTLNIRLNNRRTKPLAVKTLRDIMAWINKYFACIENLLLTNTQNRALIEPTVHKYICIEPQLSTIRTMKYRLYNRPTLHLYSIKNILWIAPEAYKDWISGKLNEEIISTCKEKIIFLYPILQNPDSHFLTNPPDRDPSTLNTNPTCFNCKWTLSGLACLENTNNRYMGIVCKKRHMGCYFCLKKLVKEKKETQEPFLCPECGEEIISTTFSGVIEAKKQGTGCFGIIEVGLNH
ncbi:hypothetical protein NEDG_02272 [Nematocida displodere]|uniref:RING-type domain-containing protein n=1 Tax=Nematocida displodere TaxID=1805483 RepID=A0A177EH79_9MICR|nr:hypothetical protein NEDG_01770 [Nematocida displodere]OAG30750.1 hypothetical protein NEDG_02144 [Nematocida displodere]OAG32571.1 hypothetical protein NEDG_02272 [Nematocida displodere]